MKKIAVKDLPQWNCQQCSAVCTKSPQNSDVDRLTCDYNTYCNFPLKISRYELLASTPLFEGHWHEQIQILYFEQGEAQIFCNATTYSLQPGDVLIINSNEIHYGLSISSHLVYHMIKPGFSLLASSQPDLCQIKYITPLKESIRFQHQIAGDATLVLEIEKIISEYAEQNAGYELAIKAHIYHILVYLLRHYQIKNDLAEQERQQKTLHQLRPALSYMDEHYAENITLNQLAVLAHMSRQHFCRLFKKLTGKRPMDHINYLRINQAAALLSDNSLNISEIAMSVGFDDSNYFSRTFKKYKRISPSALRK